MRVARVVITFACEACHRGWQEWYYEWPFPSQSQCPSCKAWCPRRGSYVEAPL